MLKPDKLRDQSVEELKLLHADLTKELFKFNNEIKRTRKMEKPHLMREKKRDRARILTVLRQKGAELTN